MINCLCLNCKKNAVLLSGSINYGPEDKREKLTELIGKNPGISFRNLMRLTNLKNGALSNHLRRLEKRSRIKVERLPRQTRFYPLGVTDDESIAAKSLRRKTSRDIIYTLMLNDRYNEGLRFAQIVSIVSKSPSTVSFYLSQLIKDNIVTAIGSGHRKKFHISNKPLIDKMIGDCRLGILEKSVSGFEDIINSL